MLSFKCRGRRNLQFSILKTVAAWSPETSALLYKPTWTRVYTNRHSYPQEDVSNERTTFFKIIFRLTVSVKWFTTPDSSLIGWNIRTSHKLHLKISIQLKVISHTLWTQVFIQKNVVLRERHHSGHKRLQRSHRLGIYSNYVHPIFWIYRTVCVV